MTSERISPAISLVMLLIALSHSAYGQQRIENPPDNADRKPPVPVQTYAVIDISGSAATSPVDRVALDDNNDAAFGFPAGQPVYSVTDHNQYQVGTWQAGQIHLQAPINVAQVIGGTNDYTSYQITTISSLTPSGTVYGFAGEWYLYETGFYWSGANFLYNRADLPNPPYGVIESDAWDASAAGYVGGEGVTYYPQTTDASSYIPYDFISSPDGKFTLFYRIFSNDPNHSPPYLGGVTGQVQVIGQYFAPARVNNKGQAIDDSHFWNGNNLAVISQGKPSDLNDQGQITVQNGDAQGNPLEGGLWEDSTAYTILAAKLPRAIRGQLKKIHPFSISNQVAPAPATNVDRTIHILATASDNSTNVNIVCTRDDAGVWTFAEIQVPQGVTISDYTTINSSGIIAAIGNAGTGDGHALLLVPCNIEPDDSYSGGSSTSQTNSVATQDITPAGGNVGGLIDSVFKGQTGKHPQKHYVSPKGPLPLLPSSYLAFKSGLPLGIASRFKWVTDKEDRTILPESGDATSDAFVKRDKADHIVLQLQAKGESPALSEKMNVWVVWATIKEKTKPNPFPKTVNNVPANDGNNYSGLKITSLTNWKFVFAISPPEIVDTSSDIPNLTGTKSANPQIPGTGKISPTPDGTDLGTGALNRWDMSRRYLLQISNPNSIKLDNFSKQASGWWYQPVPSGVVVSWPGDPCEGNDDFDNESDYPSENDDPYNRHSYPSILEHSTAELSSEDIPGILMLNGTGIPENSTVEIDFIAQEFVRIQLPSAWHVISDPLPWKMTLKFKYTLGLWHDDHSTFDWEN